MNARKMLLAGWVAWGGWAATSSAQVPAIPAAPAAGAAPAAIPGAVDPPPGQLWQFLGLTKAHKEACRRKICRTPLGTMLTSMTSPVSTLSGGIIPQFCPPDGVDPKDLAKPAESAEGAAARAKQIAAEAGARKAAVRYLGTLDCAHFPEAKDALIASLRGDPIECVRFEAALALGNGCCCNKETIEALRISASCEDSDGFPIERSERVRMAALGAMERCLSCFSEPVKEAADEPKKPEPEKPPEQGQPPAPDPERGTGQSEAEKSAAAKKSPSDARPKRERPTKLEYYAAIRKVPQAAVIAEARKTVAKLNATVMPAEFAAGSRGVANVIQFANNDAAVRSPIVVENGVPTLRADVVSPRPANLWDYIVNNDLNRPRAKPETIVTTSPEPLVAGPLLAPEAVAVVPAMPRPSPTPTVPAPKVVVARTAPEPPVEVASPPKSTAAPVPSGGVTSQRQSMKPEVVTKPSATPKQPSPTPTSAATGLPPKPIAPMPPGPKLSPAQESTSLKPLAVPAAMPAVPKPAPAVTTPKPTLPVTPIQATAPDPTPAVVISAVTRNATQSENCKQFLSAKSAVDKERIAEKLTTEDVKSSPELALALLKTAQGVEDPTVRKECIRALVRGQSLTPPIRSGLEKLTEDPVPAIRVEAAIALARLQVMQTPQIKTR